MHTFYGSKLSCTLQIDFKQPIPQHGPCQPCFDCAGHVEQKVERNPLPVLGKHSNRGFWYPGAAESVQIENSGLDWTDLSASNTQYNAVHGNCQASQQQHHHQLQPDASAQRRRSDTLFC